MAPIHRGHMSKHPAIVKIAILEFIEARMKDVVDYLTTDKRPNYRAAYGWLESSLASLSPKPDFMKWLKDNYLEFPTETEKKDVFKASADSIDDVNMKVKVYDPFTTDDDFYLILDVSWPQYLLIYGLYYDTNFKGPRQVYWEDQTPENIRNEVYGEDGVFNASTSKTEIFYTIQEMKDILEHGGAPLHST